MQSCETPSRQLTNRICDYDCDCENTYLKSLFEKFCTFKIANLKSSKELHIIPNKFTYSIYYPPTYSFICIPYVNNKSELTKDYLQKMAQYLYERLDSVDKPILHDEEAELISYQDFWGRTDDSAGVYIQALNTEFQNREALPTVAIFPYDEPDHMAMYIGGGEYGLSRADWLVTLSKRLLEQKNDLLTILNMIRNGH